MESQFSIKDINLLINSCREYRSHLKWLIGRMTQPCSQTLLNSWDAKGQFSRIYIGKSLLASVMMIWKLKYLSQRKQNLKSSAIEAPYAAI